MIEKETIPMTYIGYVYGLYEKDKIFYVGKTININRRLSEHKRKYGKNIEMKIFKECKNEYLLCIWESLYIYFYSSIYKLTNIAGIYNPLYKYSRHRPKFYNEHMLLENNLGDNGFCYNKKDYMEIYTTRDRKIIFENIGMIFTNIFENRINFSRYYSHFKKKYISFNSSLEFDKLALIEGNIILKRRWFKHFERNTNTYSNYIDEEQKNYLDGND